MGVATATFDAPVDVITLRVTATAGAGTGAFTATRGFRVFDATAYKTAALGNAGDTVQVFNGAGAVSDAISLNVADTAIARAGTIDDATYAFVVGDTLNVTTVEGGVDSACHIFVHVIPAPPA